MFWSEEAAREEERAAVSSEEEEKEEKEEKEDREGVYIEVKENEISLIQALVSAQSVDLRDSRGRRTN